jgi:hypothetical protein
MRSKILPVAAIAGGLALAGFVGCGGEESVASKSAAAFREAQKRGKTFAGDGHAHGPGAATPGGERAAPEGGHAGHDGAPGAGGAAPRHEHGGMEGTAADAMRHEGAHGGMAHGRTPVGAPGEESAGGHAGMEHRRQPAAPGAPRPAPVPPGQPAATLRPDDLDAPAATSLIDAQRAAEKAREMAGGGGHGGHGAGTYRQRDAGRGPEAFEGSEAPAPGETEPQHQHDPAEPPAAERQQQQQEKEHAHEPPGGSSTGGAAPGERRRG